MDWQAQRIPRAGLIAIIVGASLGGIGAFADGGPAEAAFLFSLPAAAVGDSWSYAIVISGSALEQSIQMTAVYHWQAPQAWVDGEGVAHAVVPLAEELLIGDLPAEHRYHLISQDDTSSLATIESRNETQMMFIEGIGESNGPELRRETVRHRSTNVTVIGPGAPPCGYVSDLQGDARPLDSLVELQGVCLPSPLGEALAWGSAELRAERVRISGMQGAVLRSGDGWLEATVLAGVPYPVSIRALLDIEPELLQPYVQAQEQKPVGIRVEWKLVEFTRGTENWHADVPLPAPGPVRPIEFAPRQVWGPVDDGVDHPFPLSAAFQHARDAPAYPDLRNFLAGHPDAALVSADHFHHEDGDRGTVERQWFMVVSDGDEAHATVARHLTGGQGTDLGGALAKFPVEIFDAFPAAPNSFTTPTLLPPQLPTVASMFQRYYHLHGEHADAWMMDGWCADCVPDIIVGRAYSIDHVGEPPAAYDLQSEFMQAIRFSSDGALREMIHRDEHVTSRAYVYQGSQPSSGPGERNAEPMDLLITPLPREVRLASVAASLGLLGLVAGVAYWSWPWIKSVSLVGLFSRVHGPRLLDHPARSQIMACISEYPGIHYQAMVDRIGRGRGAVEHHLKKLEASGLVSTARRGGYTCYYVRGEVKRDVMEAMGAVKSPIAVLILAAVVAAPGITATQLCANERLLPSTVSYHLRRMRDAGLVGSRGGRSAGLRATPVAIELMKIEQSRASAPARAPPSQRPSPAPARSARRPRASR